MKHIFLNGGRSRVGGLTFFWCTFMLHIYNFFTGIKVNMTDQSSQAELLAGHLLKVSLQRCFSYIYQHYVASVVSLNMQQFK